MLSAHVIARKVSQVSYVDFLFFYFTWR